MDASSLESAVALMVHDAAPDAGVIGDGACGINRNDLGWVLHTTASQLRANGTKNDASITQLFLHFDEFDLGDISMNKYFAPTELGVDRYRTAWQACLVPILHTPHLHLIVTGRPVDLFLVGRGQATSGPRLPPCPSKHVVLGSLAQQHIREVS